MHIKATNAIVIPASLLAGLVLALAFPRELAAQASQELPQIQETTEPFGNLRHPDLVVESMEGVLDGYEACAAKYFAVSTGDRLILLVVTEHAHTKDEVLLARSTDPGHVYSLLHRKGSADRKEKEKGSSHVTVLWIEGLGKPSVQVLELLVNDRNGRHRIEVQEPLWQ